MMDGITITQSQLILVAIGPVLGTSGTTRGTFPGKEVLALHDRWDHNHPVATTQTGRHLSGVGDLGDNSSNIS